MRTFMQCLKRFSTDESGATLTEYILLAALIAIVVIAAATLVGKNIIPLYDVTKYL